MQLAFHNQVTALWNQLKGRKTQTIALQARDPSHYLALQRTGHYKELNADLKYMGGVVRGDKQTLRHFHKGLEPKWTFPSLCVLEPIPRESK